jgi:hypothetical protein
LQHLSLEGASEVQPPIVLLKGCPDLQIIDPIFFQYAKAGKLYERFNELHLVLDGMIYDKVNTYSANEKALR